MWGAIVDRVLRRPLVSAVVAGGVLLALAAPALQLRMATPGPDTFPKSLPVIQAYTKMQQSFPGTALPANVVVQAPNVNAPVVRQAIRKLEQRALASGRMHEPITVDVNAKGTVANIAIPIDGKTTDPEAVAAIHLLRDEIVPNTVGGLPDVEAGVTGLAAQWQDGSDELKSNLPPVVVLNLLSVAAAYGVLVLVFQHGIGKGLLGFTSTAGIEPVVPLLLFVILFGLSMDYHVLVLGRIRELYDRGESMDDAISNGIKRTAGVVTSAAIVMVCVFSIFATLSMLFFKQFGVGLAVAILIDATIVRAVLLPATMKLLGEWNWYLPRWLQWLPRLEAGEPEPAKEAAPAATSA
jgi:RND superfamily putative drug exporter